MKFLNKSEKTLATAIFSFVFGFPNIENLFFVEILKVITQEPNFIIIVFVFIFNIALFVSSFCWAFYLYNNIKRQAKTKTEEQFNNYLSKLFLVGMVTLLISFILRRLIF